jgi:ubiquinone/menaquinone biosynthesis C-methylase UbiE
VVGVTGAVTGVDISPGMLAVAVERSAGDGAAPIEYVTGSAEDPPVSRGRFDVVLCQQGLQFFADRAAALTAMHDALEPGGRVGIATWTDLDGATAFSAEVEAIELHLGPEVAARMRSPFSLSDPAEVEAMVRAAGFVDIQVTRHTFTARYSRREFARRVVLAGPVSAEFAGASADCQERIVSHITSAVAACDGDAYGLRHAMTSNLITATKPAAVSD